MLAGSIPRFSPSWLLGKRPPLTYEDWQLGTSERETQAAISLVHPHPQAQPHVPPQAALFHPTCCTAPLPPLGKSGTIYSTGTHSYNCV